MTTMETTWTRTLKFFGSLYGLRPSRAQQCPRCVVGKRCQAYRRHCLCERYAQLFDHGLMWLDGSRHVLTGEPYEHITAADVAAFNQDSEVTALGLIAFFYKRGPYFPGHSVLVMVRRRLRGDDG